MKFYQGKVAQWESARLKTWVSRVQIPVFPFMASFRLNLFLATLSFFVALNIVQYLHAGRWDEIFIIIGIIIIVIFGLVFLSPFFLKGKEPFTGEVKEIKK